MDYELIDEQPVVEIQKLIPFRVMNVNVTITQRKVSAMVGMIFDYTIHSVTYTNEELPEEANKQKNV